LVEGASVRSVARSLGLSRNTVSKYLAEPEPARKARAPQLAPSRELIRDRLIALLDEWRLRTMRKQRVTVSRLHRQLIALGVEATRRRFRVAFARTANLVRTLIEARDERTLTRLHSRYQRVDLLIDELGFVPFDRACGECSSTSWATATSGARRW
jgi:predicted transcriptional regulator